MKTGKKSLNRRIRGISVGLLIVVLCFTVSLHGAGRESSFFTWNPGLFNQNSDDNRLFSQYTRFEASNRSNQVQFQEIEVKPKVSRIKLMTEISLGILGNIGCAAAGLLIGIECVRGDDDENDIAKGLMGITGAFIGSSVGSAVGVYIVGNSGDVKGSFGSALVGSLAGEVAAIVVAIATNDTTMGILAFVALPPIGAAIMFNNSLKYRSLPVTHALLNFSGDECKIGIPYFHIQALPGYAKNVKRRLRFDINLVSIVL